MSKIINVQNVKKDMNLKIILKMIIIAIQNALIIIIMIQINNIYAQKIIVVHQIILF